MVKQNIVLQCVTAKRAADLSGLSLTMVDYLARMGIVTPSGSPPGKRGIRRRFTFGDVVSLKIIKGLLESGIEISRLKSALRQLRQNLKNTPLGPLPFRYIVTNGAELFLTAEDGALETISKARGQLAFAFLIDAQASATEILNAPRQAGDWAA